MLCDLFHCQPKFIDTNFENYCSLISTLPAVRMAVVLQVTVKFEFISFYILMVRDFDFNVLIEKINYSEGTALVKSV